MPVGRPFDPSTGDLSHFAGALAAGARRELHLTPKPGLVDRFDNGSHPDLSLACMEQSLLIVAAYLDRIVASLSAGDAFAAQCAIARRAEQRLHDELGTNTHKGYIFLSGMLLIAQHRAASSDEAAVRRELGALAGTFFAADAAVPVSATHGGEARRRFGCGGIVAEACAAFPSVFDGALPAFRRLRAEGACEETSSFAMLASLMQRVEDTTALHRCGVAGLSRLRDDGAELERRIRRGEAIHPFLQQTNREYVALRLTMGGVADMLGIAFGCLLASGELPSADTL